MNIAKYVMAASIFFSHSIIFAALPPLFEDIAEIKAILEDQQLGQLLESGDSIMEIKKVEKGFLIKTNHHKLFAHVIYRPSRMPGPAQFEIEFKTARPVDE